MRRLIPLFGIVTIVSLTLGACTTPVLPAATPPAPATAVAEEASEETSAPPACAPGTGSIAVLLPDIASSSRWENDDRRYFEAALTAAGVPFTIANAQGDAATQKVQAADALAEGAQVLILVNLDSVSGAAIIAEARAAGARVVDYDRLTVEGPGADVYVSVDGYAVGDAMGQALAPLISGLETAVPQVVQLNGAPDDNNATLLRLGYSSVAQPFYNAGDWQLAADIAVPGWEEAQAQALFAQALAEAGETGIDAVFAANDTLANAVVTTLKAQGLDPIPLSGQDATVTGLQNILAGWQSMTVYKPLRDEAEAAVEAALTLLECADPAPLAAGNVINNGSRDIPYVRLNPVTVTADNIGDTVIADGFRTWEEICVGDYAALCPAAQ